MRRIVVNDRMQQGYAYELAAPSLRWTGSRTPGCAPIGTMLRSISSASTPRSRVAQLRTACRPRDLGCRRRQRQALLHWAYDARLIRAARPRHCG